MAEKIVVGPINKGIRTDRTAFVIDNDSFPVLLNAYQWRGRIKRKRGTSFLGRLTRNISQMTLTSVGSGTQTIILLFSDPSLNINASQPNASIIPMTLVVTFGTATYTDILGTGILTVTGIGGLNGTIDYSNGLLNLITSVDFTGVSIILSFLYYSTLPVLGLEELMLTPSDFPGNLAFDTIYSYNILNTSPYTNYSVSFYKNPATATYTNYVQKTTWTPTSWNGQTYQQFWTTNYQGALWTTNGISVPFNSTNVGMQFKTIVAVTVITPTTANLQIIGHGFIEPGDFLFINEVLTTTGINFQTGYVTTVTDADNVIVTFPNAAIASNGTLGIAQYLTSRSDITKDCLRFYDGPPVSSANPPVFLTDAGWVNFCPPISQNAFSISDKPLGKYYLVGARMVVPFKDRLLFIGPVIQTSTTSPIYLQDTVIFSQNGTPYYTASYTNTPSATVDTPTSVTNVFNPILVPDNQTATSPAYFEDVSGFGGFLSAGLSQSITTVSSNEDVLIMGFNNIQTRFVYTGNDLLPFNFFTINSELGSSSTFSAVNLDRGVITIGENGIVQSSQVDAQRIDLSIPDQIFEFNLLNNGFQRVCAQRDFINEWIYFTYPSNLRSYAFPNQTLQYNYRDNSWAIFNECYTTYGTFRKQTGYTWATVGTVFPTWGVWNEPWSAGSSTLLQPQVIAGNQQGFVVIRDEGTGESNSLSIQSISGSTVTSPNHCLNNGDYIVLSGTIGSISSINGMIFSVDNTTTNDFDLVPAMGDTVPSGTYLGSGVIQRMYVPLIKTKEFPVSWGLSRKTRLGAQQYLFTTTANGQITLQIYLSQNDDSPYNLPFDQIVPSSSGNNSLVYSNVLYTCPESTNLGLTPANVNLNIVTAKNQIQTWHRMNTSLLGDTVQIGFTMNDAQMRDDDFNNQFTEIELHAFVLECSPSQLLV